MPACILYFSTMAALKPMHLNKVKVFVLQEGDPVCQLGDAFPGAGSFVMAAPHHCLLVQPGGS